MAPRCHCEVDNNNHNVFCKLYEAANGLYAAVGYFDKCCRL
jgi:hypothetical protein